MGPPAPYRRAERPGRAWIGGGNPVDEAPIEPWTRPADESGVARMLTE